MTCCVTDFTFATVVQNLHVLSLMLVF